MVGVWCVYHAPNSIGKGSAGLVRLGGGGGGGCIACKSRKPDPPPTTVQLARLYCEWWHKNKVKESRNGMEDKQGNLLLHYHL